MPVCVTCVHARSCGSRLAARSRCFVCFNGDINIVMFGAKTKHYDIDVTVFVRSPSSYDGALQCSAMRFMFSVWMRAAHHN